MRTIALLVSVFALGFVANACTTETAAPVASAKPKKGKTKSPTSVSDGEHSADTPAGDGTGGTTADVPVGDKIPAGALATTTLTGAHYIAAGDTVTIAPGTTITMGDAKAAITIQGTLKVEGASANHAKLTGTAWAGIIIAEGGKLDTDGLDITGAATGLAAQAGNLDSTYKNGVLSAKTPFEMVAGSKLTIDHSKVTAGGGSAIAGTFVANYMDYDKGSNGGLTLNDAAGTMTITNSNLHGAGGGDYVISNLGKKVTVTRTTISGSHCAFHFSGSGTGAGTEAFTIDGVDVKNNGVGGMLYNSGAGPNEVKNSNFSNNNEYDISFGSNENGTITFTNTFVTIPNEAGKQTPATNIVEVDPADAKLPADQVGAPAQ
jgi:hypothetical protein